MLVRWSADVYSREIKRITSFLMTQIRKPPRGFEPPRPGSKPGALPLSYGGQRERLALPVVVVAHGAVESGRCGSSS